MDKKPIMESWTVYKSDSCKLEDYSLIGRSFIDLGEVFDWALRNSDTEFGLGVLAAMNYVTCRDEKMPEERLNDREGICKSAQTPEWINLLLKHHGDEIPLRELSPQTARCGQ